MYLLLIHSYFINKWQIWALCAAAAVLVAILNCSAALALGFPLIRGSPAGVTLGIPFMSCVRIPVSWIPLFPLPWLSHLFVKHKSSLASWERGQFFLRLYFWNVFIHPLHLPVLPWVRHSAYKSFYYNFIFLNWLYMYIYTHTYTQSFFRLESFASFHHWKSNDISLLSR